MTNDITGDIIKEVGKEKRLAAIKSNPKGVRFTDLLKAAADVGFQIARQKGSHMILKHPTIPEFLNLQDDAGEAKPYQVRQFLDIVETYKLG